MTRITGKQARDLLEGATSGPWEWYWDQGLISLKSASGEPVATDLAVEDSDLAAAAPDLAETIAWLHERIEQLSAMWHKAGNEVLNRDSGYAYTACADMLDLVLLYGEEARDESE